MKDGLFYVMLVLIASLTACFVKEDKVGVEQPLPQVVEGVTMEQSINEDALETILTMYETAMNGDIDSFEELTVDFLVRSPYSVEEEMELLAEHFLENGEYSIPLDIVDISELTDFYLFELEQRYGTYYKDYVVVAESFDNGTIEPWAWVVQFYAEGNKVVQHDSYREEGSKFVFFNNVIYGYEEEFSN
ncbi:hypothetical protein [Bacillus alkalicellulosilyticus]|uniref:hypothetical protein n=1 Tax=Alkalihalobacterium alkalicellulosilyticum TaxID=1912214 RepID=UPI000995F2EE|nr:hypothetical protein [Bacillus alkalicellulosilyticus]